MRRVRSYLGSTAWPAEAALRGARGSSTVLVRGGVGARNEGQRKVGTTPTPPDQTTTRTTYDELRLENERLRLTIEDLRRELAQAKMSAPRRFGQFVTNMPRKKFYRLLLVSFLVAQTALVGGVLFLRSRRAESEDLIDGRREHRP